MELVVGGKDGLQPVERTVIDLCTRLVYRDVLQNPDTAPMPILQDLYNLLNQQPEAEAKRLATALEIYVTGSLNVFNHRTNVDMSNRLVCFDIKELGKFAFAKLYSRATMQNAKGFLEQLIEPSTSSVFLACSAVSLSEQHWLLITPS